VGAPWRVTLGLFCGPVLWRHVGATPTAPNRSGPEYLPLRGIAEKGTQRRGAARDHGKGGVNERW